jgi:hypothetical protein
MDIYELMYQYQQSLSVVKMNDDYKYDIDGQNIGAILDENDVHCKKEKSGIRCFNRILTGTTELKSEDKTQKTLFIEYEIDKQGNGTFQPSGIKTSEAGTWRINIKRLVIEVDTNFLKFCYENKEKFQFLITNSFDDRYVGKGFCIPMTDLLDIHNIWEDYDAGDDLDLCIARYTNPEQYRKLIMKNLTKK